MATRGIGRRLAGAVVALLVGAAVLATAQGTAVASTSAEQELVQRTNQSRVAAGLAPLVVHPGLAADARAWSSTMLSTGRFAHTTTLGPDTARHLPDYRRAGENIGRGGSIAAMHDAFMASPGHRANVLGDYNAVGIGVVRGGDGSLWVTVRFAKSASVHAPVGGSAFSDVPDQAFYGSAVAWMKREGLTTGVGGTSYFFPDASVTRGELATFVHRLAGSPAPRGRAPFPDVPAGAYYQRAVDWMYAEGLTRGVGSTGLYRPDDPVDRGQLATFLHRLAGSPTGARHGFVDVQAGHFAHAGVGWMSRHGITTGVGGSNTFQPAQPVTRGQLATFLHRMVSTPSSLSGSAIPLSVGP
ncbi:CAP and S-layer homology domain-containing protein [Actinomarinicola tropica]|uniref:SLH domain-containing protein n=1 Tax=Actinomarinicola tropica TaxID=2789776 RepID=A0A5Q2RG93_9ACTN|nr:S-layer homology domain-containing protein [Actinomarinicola tropica]QGG95839.1 hypothetical protein GH723_12430 [Actinomarinicola tropica]